MRLLIYLMFFLYTLNAQSIVVLNSNASVDKYKSVQNGFEENFKGQYEVLDVSKISQQQVKEFLYDEYPDIVYAIGTKAYSYANMYVPEKRIVFSSIMNYKRIKLNENRYGVSTEIYSGVQLTLIKSLFSDVQTLSIVYSHYTKDLFESFKRNATLMNIKIIAQEISKSKSIDNRILENSDGFILLADPLLLKSEHRVISLFKDAKRLKRPIFAYHELFLKLGASMVISADNPTIGRQVSSMLSELKTKNLSMKIQMPMGTSVIFNKKAADEMQLNYDNMALSVVDKVIE